MQLSRRSVTIGLLRLIIVVGVLGGPLAAVASAHPVYRVRPGDTLSEIAKNDDTTIIRLERLNRLSPTSPLLAGSELSLPAPSVPELRYVVAPGDTLSGIALRFGTTPAAIAAASGIASSGPILIGTTLRVPSLASGRLERPEASVHTLDYVVAPGDTLSGIALRFGTTPAAIAAASGIAASGPILIGTTLRVPGVSDAGSSPAQSSYEVRSGDTLDGIAARYGLSLGVLADMNHLDVDAPLLVGTRLVLPAGASAGGAPGVETASVRASLVRWADHYGVSEQLVTALAWMESGFNNNLVSSAGAVGVMQITPDTWNYVEQVLLLGQSVPDTYDGNVRIGVAYLHHLLHIYDGDPYRALAAYYQGARSLLLQGFLPGTTQYVEDILALAQRF